MKIAPAQAESFVKSPAKGVRVLLAFGNDEGMTEEYTQRFAGSLTGLPADKLEVLDFTAKEIADDPARLADEWAASSLFGDVRVIRVRHAGEKLVPTLTGLLGVQSGNVLLLTAESLPPKSKLRVLCETHPQAAAIGCYADEGQVLTRLVQGMLSEAGKRAQPDALTYLSEHVGMDRAVTRKELEKLLTYMGEAKEITLEDVQAVVGDVSATSLDDCLHGMFGGLPSQLDHALTRLFQEGTQPIMIIRVLLRRALLLQHLRGAMEAGASLDQAIEQARPPLFFKQKPQVRQELSYWTVERLSQCLSMLFTLEKHCKSSLASPQTLTAQAMLVAGIRT
jgi:DNA polymerase-3 subunit delta